MHQMQYHKKETVVIAFYRQNDTLYLMYSSCIYAVSIPVATVASSEVKVKVKVSLCLTN
jgi:hypothetical protein